MLDPRAVATQGLAISPRLAAVNGLWPLPRPNQDVGALRLPRKLPQRKPHKDDDVLIFLL